jgi:hypothetical protein
MSHVRPCRIGFDRLTELLPFAVEVGNLAEFAVFLAFPAAAAAGVKLPGRCLRAADRNHLF